MKTNKSFLKRLKITRRGKVLARKAGHNHFNAKRSGKERAAKRRARRINNMFDRTATSRFLVH